MKLGFEAGNTSTEKHKLRKLISKLDWGDCSVPLLLDVCLTTLSVASSADPGTMLFSSGVIGFDERR